VGLSYGIKELSDSVEKLEEIMHAADEALYESKGNKRMLRT
jgi:PleD family two-component response regulator